MNINYPNILHQNIDIVSFTAYEKSDKNKYITVIASIEEKTNTWCVKTTCNFYDFNINNYMFNPQMNTLKTVKKLLTSTKSIFYSVENDILNIDIHTDYIDQPIRVSLVKINQNPVELLNRKVQYLEHELETIKTNLSTPKSLVGNLWIEYDIESKIFNYISTCSTEKNNHIFSERILNAFKISNISHIKDIMRDQICNYSKDKCEEAIKKIISCQKVEDIYEIVSKLRLSPSNSNLNWTCYRFINNENLSEIFKVNYLNILFKLPRDIPGMKTMYNGVNIPESFRYVYNNYYGWVDSSPCFYIPEVNRKLCICIQVVFAYDKVKDLYSLKNYDNLSNIKDLRHDTNVSFDIFGQVNNFSNQDLPENSGNFYYIYDV